MDLADVLCAPLCSTAIEEELEVLYDAYYEDLEHYAALQQQHASAGGPPPPGPGPFPGSVALDSNGAVIGVQQNQHPGAKHPRGRNHLVPQQPQPALTNGVARKPGLTPQPGHPQQQQQQRLPPAQDEEEYDDEDGDEYDDDEDYDDEEEDDEGDEEDDGEEESNTGLFDSNCPSPSLSYLKKPLNLGKASAKRKGSDMFSFSSNFTAAGEYIPLMCSGLLAHRRFVKVLEIS